MGPRMQGTAEIHGAGGMQIDRLNGGFRRRAFVAMGNVWLAQQQKWQPDGHSRWVGAAQVRAGPPQEAANESEPADLLLGAECTAGVLGRSTVQLAGQRAVARPQAVGVADQAADGQELQGCRGVGAMGRGQRLVQVGQHRELLKV